MPRTTTLLTKSFLTKSLTVSTAVKSMTDFAFTAANLAKAKRARISAATAEVSFTLDGTTPTATIGHPVMTNTTVIIDGDADIARLKFIRRGGTDSVVTITLEESYA